MITQNTPPPVLVTDESGPSTVNSSWKALSLLCWTSCHPEKEESKYHLHHTSISTSTSSPVWQKQENHIKSDNCFCNCLLHLSKTFRELSISAKRRSLTFVRPREQESIWLVLSVLRHSSVTDSHLDMCTCSSWGGKKPEHDVTTGLSLCLTSCQAVSRAKCPGICQSEEEVGPDPPASGRRFVEGPGFSVTGARPSGPEYDSKEARL